MDGFWNDNRIYCTLIPLATTLHKPMYYKLCLSFFITFDFRLKKLPHFYISEKSKSHCDWRSVNQSLTTSVEPHLWLMTRYLLLFNSYGLVFVGRPLWREDESVFCLCCWPLPALSFSGPNPLGLANIFYCLRFETSLFVASCLYLSCPRS
jgi:hypothetical protein